MLPLIAGLTAASLPTVDFAPRVELPAGGAVVIEAPVQLPRGLDRAGAELTVYDAGPGVHVYRAAEVVARGPRSRLRWALAAGPQPTSADVRLEVSIRGPRRLIRRVRIRQRVDVVASPLTDDAAVKRALARVEAAPEDDRGDAVTPTDLEPRQGSESAPPLAARSDVQQWAAVHALMRAAERNDDWGRRAWAAVATSSIARSSPRRTADLEAAAGESFEAKALLVRAAEALRSFDAEGARQLLARARTVPELSRGELARTLELQGCLQAALGGEASGRRTWTQALSLFPEIDAECPIAWGRTHFAALRPTLAPDRALDVGRVGLRLLEEGLEVTVDVGPDPGRLARTVEVTVSPHPEEPLVARTLPLEHAQATARSRMVLPTARPPSAQVPVSVRVFDDFGARLASEGEPDPMYVPLPRAERSFRVPAWVWWVAGGLAVAGGATAAAIAAADGAGPTAPDRNLGPVDIRF